MTGYELIPLGDSAIKIKLGDTICLETNKKVHFLANRINERNLVGVVEVVPSYHSVTVYYQPAKKTYENISSDIRHIVEEELTTKHVYQTEIIYIPTLYGADVGVDLEKVAGFHQISKDEVIHIHSHATYFVYLLGFLPGFPYLGGMSKKIATPRFSKPRRSVDEGSVGIAGMQTGIYPLKSPGGWNIIGQTPLKIFRPNEQDPFLLKAGYFLRFEPITTMEFVAIRRLDSLGKFQIKKEVYQDEFSY